MVDKSSKFCINKNLAFSLNGTVPGNTFYAVLFMIAIMIVVFLPWESLTNIVPDAWRRVRMANENVFGNEKTPGNVTRYVSYTLFTNTMDQFMYLLLPIYFLFQHACRGYFGFGVTESMVISSFILTFVSQTNLLTLNKYRSESFTVISLNPILFTIFFIRNIILLYIFQRARTLWIPIFGLTGSILVNTALSTAIVFGT